MLSRTAAIAAAGLVLLMPLPVDAQGLTDLHSKVRIGSKICFVDHYHDGFSSGHSNRKAAERAAIQSWQEFTSFEYGSAWSRFKLAAGQGVRCSQTAGSWGCSVQARACAYRGRRR